MGEKERGKGKGCVEVREGGDRGDGGEGRVTGFDSWMTGRERGMGEGERR